MTGLSQLRVRIFADGADPSVIGEMGRNPWIQGFTTNPTLMRKANVSDYRSFAFDVLRIIGTRPVSFEVFSDEFDEMERQAHEIASWGDNVFVKIPVMNTRADFSGPLIERLSSAGVQVNVTAVLTIEQVAAVCDHLSPDTPSVVSVFAGRIADTGRDPIPVMTQAAALLSAREKAELLWASPRELLNIFHADAAGCHIITATKEVLAKLPQVGKDLDALSLETVRMFRDDAIAAAYTI